MRFLFAIAAVCLLAGCASTSAPQSRIEAGAPYSLSAAEVEMVKAGIKRSLKDPTSPLFGTMIATRNSKGDLVVCGYVNAKNSFGGYVGDKPYIGGIVGADKKAFVVIGMGGTDIETTSVNSVCADSGIYL